jgi:hypothetical protein
VLRVKLALTHEEIAQLISSRETFAARSANSAAKLIDFNGSQCCCATKRATEPRRNLIVLYRLSTGGFFAR